jgi:thiazole synthase
VRTLRLAREAGGWDLVKLEVLSNTKHLLPTWKRRCGRSSC